MVGTGDSALSFPKHPLHQRCGSLLGFNRKNEAGCSQIDRDIVLPVLQQEEREETAVVRVAPHWCGWL